MNHLLVYLTHPHVEAWNFKPFHRDLLARNIPGLRVTLCRNSREFLDRLPEADAVAVWYFKKEWLDRASRLRLIATPAAGGEWIEPEPSRDLNISFGGFHGLMMAETVTGAMFYFLKAFSLSSQMQKKKKWAPVKISARLGSLHRARVTVLGFGRIGTALGRVLKPFGCTLTGVKRRAVPPPDYFDEADRIVPVEDLPDVLPGTDHLVLLLPGGPQTDHLLTRDHFRRLPRTCFLYNLGRGNVYREEDLVEALTGKQLAGAYLDVFGEEPLPETSPLWDLDNVLIQPHVSAASPQYLEWFADELADRWVRGLFRD